MQREPNPTWQDIKQLAWCIMLVFAFIALGAFGLVPVFGTRTAVWVGMGLAVFVTASYVLIVGMCVLGSYAFDMLVRVRDGRGALRDET